MPVAIFYPLKKSALILLLHLLITTQAQTQNCSDSITISTAIGFTFDIGSTRFALNKGNYFKQGLIKDPSGDFTKSKLVFLLNDPAGKLLSAKVMDNPVPGFFIRMHIFTEGENNSIIGIGSLVKEKQDDTYDSTILVLKLNDQLELQWAKWIDKNFDRTIPSLFIPQTISCGKDGTIYAAVANDQSATTKDFLFFSLASTGELIWSQAIDDRSFSSHSSFNINAVAAIDDHVFFMGNYIKGITTRYFVPGMVGLKLKKASGELEKCRIFRMPYTREGQGSGTAGIRDYNDIKLHPSSTGFSYCFSEYNSINGPNNIINCWLDTNLHYSGTRKIAGRISSLILASRLALSPHHQLAFTGYEPVFGFTKSTQFALIDSLGNTIISKKINDFGISRQQISNLDINNDGKQLSMLISDISDNQFAYQATIPLWQNYELANCLGKDSSFFSIIPVNFQEEVIDKPVLYSDVVYTTDKRFTLNSITFPTQELCKTVSVCNTISIVGEKNSCTGIVKTFLAKKNKECLRKITWSQGGLPVQIISQTDSSISLRFMSAGTGYVKATIENCTFFDSIAVSVHSPINSFSLGSNTVICKNDSMLLKGPGGYKKYHWNTGDTTTNLKVFAAGEYSLQVTDFCDNTVTSTITLSYPLKPLQVGDKIKLCLNDTAFIEATPNFSNYNWQPSIANGIIAGRLFYVNPTASTLFRVKAIDKNGCNSEQSFMVNVEECIKGSWFPSGFTPNGDGLNDQFGPIIKQPLEFFFLRIYDRAGNLIFTNKEINTKWDGRWKGKDVPVGIYVWQCNYKLKDEHPRFSKGTLTLIR